MSGTGPKFLVGDRVVLLEHKRNAIIEYCISPDCIGLSGMILEWRNTKFGPSYHILFENENLWWASEDMIDYEDEECTQEEYEGEW